MVQQCVLEREKKLGVRRVVFSQENARLRCRLSGGVRLGTSHPSYGLLALPMSRRFVGNVEIVGAAAVLAGLELHCIDPVLRGKHHESPKLQR